MTDSILLSLNIRASQLEVSRMVLKYVLENGWVDHLVIVEVSKDDHKVTTPCLAGAVGPHYGPDVVVSFLKFLKGNAKDDGVSLENRFTSPSSEQVKENKKICDRLAA